MCRSAVRWTGASLYPCRAVLTDSSWPLVRVTGRPATSCSFWVRFNAASHAQRLARGEAHFPASHTVCVRGHAHCVSKENSE